MLNKFVSPNPWQYQFRGRRRSGERIVDEFYTNEPKSEQTWFILDLTHPCDTQKGYRVKTG